MLSKLRYQKGDRIGERYLVHEALAGGMGEVYLCLDVEEDLPFALKTFKSPYLRGADSGHALSMFREEVATWIALENHPNIVRCFYMDTLDDRPFMFLEWVVNQEGRGTDLRSWLRHGALDLRLALDFTINVCQGLMYANKKQPGIVHRDLKPENILIGLGRLAKLTDFGLAKVAHDSQLDVAASEEESEQARLSNLGGTPLYMAPEQWRGEVPDSRTDIYAVGCTLYEMLTGQWPYRTKTVAGLRRLHLEAPVPPLPQSGGVYAKLNALLSRCLGKRKSERFSSAEELLKATVQIYQEEFGSLPQLMAEPHAPHALDLNNRAATFLRLERYDRALEYVERSLELDSRYAPAHYNRGLILYHQDHYEECLPHFDRAIELDPQDAISYYNRGLAYSRLKRSEEAQNDYRRAISLDPNYARSHYNLAALLAASGHLEEALRECDIAIKLDPEDPLAYHNRAGIFYELGRTDEALADYGKAIELNPQNLSPYAMRAIVHEVRGERDKALADFEKAAELGDEHAAIIVSSFAKERAMKAFLEADSPEEMRRQAARIPMMTDGLFLSQLELSRPPNLNFDVRLIAEIKLSWLRYFANEPEGQTESLLQTEEDFFNASYDAFFNARTFEEMTEAVTEFPYLMIPSVDKDIEKVVEKSSPEDKSYLEQRLAWLRKIIEARTKEWQQEAAHEPRNIPARETTGAGPLSQAQETELALTALVSSGSYVEAREVVARYPFLAAPEFLSSFEIGIRLSPQAKRQELEQRLSWIRQINAEGKEP